MAKLRRIVLDVLKPHEPSVIDLSQSISAAKGVDCVDITIVSVDRKVENARITIEGQSLNYDRIKKIINDNGGTVKSIDRASSGAVMSDRKQVEITPE
ncbi:DUF211 domain-containing protein [Candidatus Woesearchaeota archaeon]|nr:DUF211 domain-containing protein [Candidatus Woesearchaeota archaeon]